MILDTLRRHPYVVGVVICLIAPAFLFPFLESVLPLEFWSTSGGKWLREIKRTFGVAPLINSPEPQSPSSENRAQMMNIKLALVRYTNDLGHPPFVGSTLSSSSLDLADTHCLGITSATNVLISDRVGHPFENLGLDAHTYPCVTRGVGKSPTSAEQTPCICTQPGLTAFATLSR